MCDGHVLTGTGEKDEFCQDQFRCQSPRPSLCSPSSIPQNTDLSTETFLCPPCLYPSPHPPPALPGLPTENTQYSKLLLFPLIKLPLPHISVHQSPILSLQLWPTTPSLLGQMPRHSISIFPLLHPLPPPSPSHLPITLQSISLIPHHQHFLPHPSTFTHTPRQNSSSSLLPCSPKSHAPTMPSPPQIRQRIPSQITHNLHHQILPLAPLYGALSPLPLALHSPIPPPPLLSMPATSLPSLSKHISYEFSSIVRQQTKSFLPSSSILTACLASLRRLPAVPLLSTHTTSTDWSLQASPWPVNSSVTCFTPTRDTPRCVILLPIFLLTMIKFSRYPIYIRTSSRWEVYLKRSSTS